MTISRLKKIRLVKKRNFNKIIKKNEDCVTRESFATYKFIWRIIKKKMSIKEFNELKAQLSLYKKQLNETGITNLLHEINKKYGDYNAYKDSHCHNESGWLNQNNSTNIDHKKWRTTKKHDLTRKIEREIKNSNLHFTSVDSLHE